MLGAVAGVLMAAVVLRQGGSAALGAALLDVLWAVAVFVAWGWALGRLFEATCATDAARPVARPAGDEPPPPSPFAPPRPLGPPEAVAPQAVVPEPEAEPAAPAGGAAERLDRRHFIVRMGGLVATFVVLGAEVADILSVEGGPAVAPVTKAPIPFPNAGSPVKPVPGTRPEYTPVAEHYRVDIDLSPPSIDGSSWRLRISGLVARPLQLTLDQLRSDYRCARPVHHPGVHLEPRRRAAHRDHAVERPFLPRRPCHRAAAAVCTLRSRALSGWLRRGRRPGICSLPIPR